jgi:hypothetical protein
MLFPGEARLNINPIAHAQFGVNKTHNGNRPKQHLLILRAADASDCRSRRDLVPNACTKWSAITSIIPMHRGSIFCLFAQIDVQRNHSDTVRQMRVQDLNIGELLQMDPDGGMIRFADHRVLLLDAGAMGLLRKYLVDNFGLTATRTVLTQFGYAHGWRMADAIAGQFEWDTDDDKRFAVTRLSTLQGLFRLAVDGQDALSAAGAMLVDSYEAEQHLAHVGRGTTCVCWTITGLLSGYLSRTEGHEVIVLEDRCVARGDAACHLVARSREDWKDERAEDLRFFARTQLKETLDVSLQTAIEALKITEEKLLLRSRALTKNARWRWRPKGWWPTAPPWCTWWTWPGASPSTTPRCSSPVRAAPAKSASRA